MAIFKVGPCGGEGGDPRNMDNINYSTRIVKICVYYSKYIHAITIYYTVDGGEDSVTWGVPGGTLEEFTLQPDEYITNVNGSSGGSSVDGWCGLRKLIFETSNNKEHAFGPEVGTEFELPAIPNVPAFGAIPNVRLGEIIGFHGRSDGIGLNALGVHIKVGLAGASTGTGF